MIKNKNIFSEGGNSLLKDKTYNLEKERPDIVSKLKEILNIMKNKNISGISHMENLIDNSNSISYSWMNKMLSDFKRLRSNGISETDNEFLSYGGKELEQWITNKLNQDIEAIKSMKKSTSQVMNNQFIKSHEKQRVNTTPIKIGEDKVNKKIIVTEEVFNKILLKIQ